MISKADKLNYLVTLLQTQTDATASELLDDISTNSLTVKQKRPTNDLSQDDIVLMTQLVLELKTKTSKIKMLYKNEYNITQISKFLDIKYQFAYNILKYFPKQEQLAKQYSIKQKK